jgi:phosphate transport system substrate-binding protein
MWSRRRFAASIAALPLSARVALAESDVGYATQVVAMLPEFQPDTQATGVVSIWGHGRRDLPWMLPLLRRWETGLRVFHADFAIDYQMYGTSSGVPSLFTGVGDIAILGEEILPEAENAFRKATGYAPLGIEIATGSLDVRNFDYAQQCFVHVENPLNQLTLAQMDGVFGAEHRRGHKNIRRWGELGLRGAWADRVITPYSWKLDDSFAFFIQQSVLKGSHRWNCAVHEFAHINRADGSIYDHGQQILDALARDPYGIGVSNIRYASSQVKALALSVGGGAPFVSATRRSLIDLTYPLARTIPAVINRAPGAVVVPKVREFLRYILSRQGQDAIVQDGKYLPLNADCLLAQRAKLA